MSTGQPSADSSSRFCHMDVLKKVCGPTLQLATQRDSRVQSEQAHWGAESLDLRVSEESLWNEDNPHMSGQTEAQFKESTLRA